MLSRMSTPKQLGQAAHCGRGTWHSSRHCPRRYVSVCSFVVSIFIITIGGVFIEYEVKQ